MRANNCGAQMCNLRCQNIYVRCANVGEQLLARIFGRANVGAQMSGRLCRGANVGAQKWGAQKSDAQVSLRICEDAKVPHLVYYLKIRGTPS